MKLIFVCLLLVIWLMSSFIIYTIFMDSDLYDDDDLF